MNSMYLIITFPLISFLVLSFFKRFLSRKFTIVIGVGSIFLSMLTIFLTWIIFSINGYYVFSHELWVWWYLKNFKVSVCLLLDMLSLSFVVMIICISFLIYIFSIWYMKYKEGNNRFFALMNLFVANMLLLVLANNFILMYVGWEGVSICSYLLINFYYFKKKVGFAAIKSLIMTRIGDLFLILAILMIYFYYETLNFYEIQFLIKIGLIKYTSILNWITFLLLLGAAGKSAQIPLHTWLPEAMVGPTPVSALIHAATMVTSGIYLIARNHDLFILTPSILYLVGVLGVSTLLLSSFSALVQKDIKKILAYSTMSQIGYMFLGLSVGAWSASVIHLITHAIFKALLFLSAGSLIITCNYKQNIFKMGNQLRKKLSFLYFCFLIGGASLSAFPIFTSGFYSKGNILFHMLSYHFNIFFILSLLSSFLTSIYVFRFIFIIFYTKSNTSKIIKPTGLIHFFPLTILMLFSTCFEVCIIPNLSSIFPEIMPTYLDKVYLEYFSSLVIILGVGVSYYFYILNTNITKKILKNKYLFFIFKLLFNGLRIFDMYKILFIQPYLKMIQFLRFNYFNMIFKIILLIFKKINICLLYVENQSLNGYIFLMIIGLISIMIYI
ncbi:NADH-quinone oxidoreductase subunit L [Buchnera aphidicola (Phyllaphis fagi)]|uniref:NADH-quinone oxidoreductase subunit L n=1 Tax=Buchnera aphidicola TaxID=9 RepID=UPI00346439CE